jgi:hypothetical protein
MRHRVALRVLMLALACAAYAVAAAFLEVPLSAAVDCSVSTCYYIRDGGTASVTGTGACVSTGSGDWNTANACDTFPATLVRGAFYLVADGSYAGRTFSTAASANQLITIQKATTTEHGTETGWLSTYGDGQAIWTGALTFSTDDWVFDGKYRNESNWFDGTAYGFSIATTGDEQLFVGNFGANCAVTVDNQTFRYLYISAPVGGLPGGTIRRYAIDTDLFGCTDTGQGHTNLTFSRMFVNGSNNVWFIRFTNGTIIEYSASDCTAGNGTNHGEVINLYFNGENAVIRWNWFRNAYNNGCGQVAGGGTAPIASTFTNGHKIYGNIFDNFDVGDGAFGFTTTGDTSNTVFYNNTIVKAATGGGFETPSGSGNSVRNNLWVGNFGSSVNAGSGATITHNGYSGGSGAGTSTQVNIPTSIFTNYAGDTYTLASATTAGVPLPSPYDVDMLGHTRGGDGTWDRGALEFCASGCQGSAAPGAPRMQLRIHGLLELLTSPFAQDHQRETASDEQQRRGLWDRLQPRHAEIDPLGVGRIRRRAGEQRQLVHVAGGEQRGGAHRRHAVQAKDRRIDRGQPLPAVGIADAPAVIPDGFINGHIGQAREAVREIELIEPERVDVERGQTVTDGREHQRRFSGRVRHASDRGVADGMGARGERRHLKQANRRGGFGESVSNEGIAIRRVRRQALPVTDRGASGYAVPIDHKGVPLGQHRGRVLLAQDLDGDGVGARWRRSQQHPKDQDGQTHRTPPLNRDRGAYEIPRLRSTGTNVVTVLEDFC